MINKNAKYEYCFVFFVLSHTFELYYLYIQAVNIQLFGFIKLNIYPTYRVNNR